jgi:hypothetical protein
MDLESLDDAVAEAESVVAEMAKDVLPDHCVAIWLWRSGRNKVRRW